MCFNCTSPDIFFLLGPLSPINQEINTTRAAGGLQKLNVNTLEVVQLRVLCTASGMKHQMTSNLLLRIIVMEVVHYNSHL